MKKIILLLSILLVALLLNFPVLASGIPEDGVYSISVNLSGGSGKAFIESPAVMTVQNGEASAVVIWSSPFYDLMTIAGVQYKPIQKEGNATFEIPIVLDTDIALSARTFAMSKPHEIEYTLRFDSSDMQSADAPEDSWTVQRSMELQYATNFSIDYFAGGYKLITLADESRFLVVPENAETPKNLESDIVILKQPIQKIYLAATSAMSLFDALNAMSSIRLSGTKEDGWFNDNARKAMKEGKILYAGKYSEPDYELILSEGCELAIESTMIGHTPDVKEKLIDLGVPVLIDQSSREQHPLGRTEWLKLYGALMNKEDEAEQFFNEQIAFMNEAAMPENTGKTVAFFYIASSGYAVARKSGDYVPKMIEIAGGNYVFTNLGDPDTSTSTVPLEMEKFYAIAKDADFVIYNSTIGGEIQTMNQFLQKNKLLSDFKAVKTHNVWCTSKDLFQETTRLGQMILDIHQMLVNEDPELVDLTFLHRLKE